MAVSSPEFHIFTLADKDIAERCMAVVAWTAHHHVVAVDLSREQHAVTVEWKECVLKLNEFLEVIGVSNTDGRAVIAVAPGLHSICRRFCRHAGHNGTLLSESPRQRPQI